MNSISEKEKKLLETLDKLKNLENIKPDKILELENLENQKNQLEIEKKEIEQRYNSLQQENQTLRQKFDNFKKLADIKHEIYDDDLHTLVSSKYSDQPSKYFKLINIKSSSNFNNKAESEVTIFYKNKENKTTASGGGAVDATFKAIEKIVKSDSLLRLYSVNNITDGTDSLGEVTVRLEKNNVIVNGLGADSDIVVASAKAYIDALNKLYELLKIK